MAIRKKFHSKQGAALVEFAIAVPVIALMALLFWDTAIDLNLRIRMAATMLQMASQFQKPTLIANVQEEPVTQVIIAPLNQPQQRSMRVDFNGFYNALMQTSGSFANKTSHNVATTFAYLCISEGPSTDAPTECGGGPPPGGFPEAGYPYAYFYRGTNFFVNPGPSNGTPNTCFGTGNERQKLQDEMTAYVRATLNRLIDDTQETNKSGIVMLNTPLKENERLEAYAPFRAMLFWMSCAKSFKVFSDKATIDKGVFFADKVGVNF